MNVRNEIKAQIIRAGMTMQEVVDLLSDCLLYTSQKSNQQFSLIFWKHDRGIMNIKRVGLLV